MTIYKSFLGPHLDYSDIICDQGKNYNFHQKLELFQYNAALSIKDAIRGTSEEKLWRMESFAALLRYTIVNLLTACSNFKLILSYQARNSHNIPRSKWNINFSKTHLSLLPYLNLGWASISTTWNRYPTLREKCPNTEFFLVRIFPYSDWIRRDTEYLSVFSLSPYSVWIREILRISPYSVWKRENTDQKKLRIWTPFTQCYFRKTLLKFSTFFREPYLRDKTENRFKPFPWLQNQIVFGTH